jgi:hypothetical protein
MLRSRKRRACAGSICAPADNDLHTIRSAALAASRRASVPSPNTSFASAGLARGSSWNLVSNGPPKPSGLRAPGGLADGSAAVPRRW